MNSKVISKHKLWDVSTINGRKVQREITKAIAVNIKRNYIRAQGL